MPRPKDVWDAQPFGEVPDSEIAKRLGVTTPAVHHQRRKRGIEAHSERVGPTIDWDAQPFGEVTDREIAAMLGVTVQAVSHQRRKRGIDSWMEKRRKERAEQCKDEPIDWDAQPLGEIPDTEIARRVGRTRECVRQHRSARGIPACCKRGGPRRTDINWDDEPLGLTTDASIARRLGVDPSAVTHQRRKRGISRYLRSKA